MALVVVVMMGTLMMSLWEERGGEEGGKRTKGRGMDIYQMRIEGERHESERG
jgi:hypothetical protein